MTLQRNLAETAIIEKANIALKNYKNGSLALPIISDGVPFLENFVHLSIEEQKTALAVIFTDPRKKQILEERIVTGAIDSYIHKILDIAEYIPMLSSAVYHVRKGNLTRVSSFLT